MNELALEERIKRLREKGGVDLTKLQSGCRLWIETAHGVHKMTVQEGDVIQLESTESPFKVETPVIVRLLRSVWDDKGEVTIPHWVGYCMWMVFDLDGVEITTSCVGKCRVEAPDGAWEFEVWES